ncbi:uncharacterized protein TNCV_434581 [Trichonephila clavipes]|nr:uncharacterized protein TNCV_434581 [Trichonephila clavipes]
MIRLLIQVLVLSVLAVSSVIAFKGYDNDFISFAIRADTCVGHSGDQEKCDNYVACTRKFPKQLEKEFDSCIRSTYPSGTLYKCTENQSLFGSPDEHIKLNRLKISASKLSCKIPPKQITLQVK